MGIPIEKRFVINAAPQEVWAFLTDPSKVAGCLPGAAITGQVDERTHTGTIAIKVGPVSARYKGTVRFERLDREEGVAEIAAVGQDVRGKGGADMRMTSRIIARGPSETEVTVASTVNVTGILAQFGRGMIQDVSDQMFRQFTDAMRAELESAPDRVGADGPVGDRPVADSAGAQAPGGAAPGSDAIDAVSLGAKVGGRALGRVVRRPGFWLAAVIVGAAIFWLVYSRLS